MRKELSPALFAVIIVVALAAVGGVMWWRSNHIGDGKQSGGFAQNEKLRAAIGKKYREETGATDNNGAAAPGTDATANPQGAQPAEGAGRSLSARPGGRNLRRGD
jgi:hypothetical protein